MKPRDKFSKFIYLIKQNSTHILLSLIVVILLCGYFIIFAIPYGEENNFYNAGSYPKTYNQIMYSLIVLPFIIGYIRYLFYVYKNLNFARFFIYPILFFVLFFCITISLSILGGEFVLLFLYLSVFLFPICLIITEIYAIIQDVKTFKSASFPNK